MDAPPIQYVTTSDGYNIAYCVSGEGRPLVSSSPPLGHLNEMWRRPAMRPVYEELAARFRLIQFDFRGQGLSERGLREGLTLKDWELDLEAVVAREKLDTFILLGHHSNGHICVNYALRNPERVVALVLHGVPFARNQSVPVSLDQMARENWEFFLDAAGRTSFPWEEPAVAREMMRETWNQVDWAIRARLWRDFTIEGVLERLQVPTLVLRTRFGAYAYVDDESTLIAAKIPNAHLVVFDEPGGGFGATETGHLPLRTSLRTS